MAYNLQTARVLIALGYQSIIDFDAGEQNDVITLDWKHGDPQPTEQQILDYINGVSPLPSGELFSEWSAEHGGDSIKTAKRLSKDLFDRLEAESRILRAIVTLTVDEINILRQWIVAFKAAVAAAANLADLKTRVSSLPNTPDRTYDQARTAIRNNVDAQS